VEGGKGRKRNLTVLPPKPQALCGVEERKKKREDTLIEVIVTREREKKMGRMKR